MAAKDVRKLMSQACVFLFEAMITVEQNQVG
jgi:hypothetical protein